MHDITPCPSALGYRMPAEWELHEATWLSWPHDLETWPDQLAKVEETYVEVIEHLCLGEKIHILLNDESQRDHVLKKLCQRGITRNVFVHHIETDSIWIRDYGPISLVRKSDRLAFAKWRFNAWGRKYDAFEKDNRVSDALRALTHAEEFRPGIIFEGGSIDVNGAGTCLATEQCLLSPNRNPAFGRSEIEKYLMDFLGVRHVIWLWGGIAGDDTDGHVDEVARFVSLRTVVAAIEKDPGDQNYDSLRKNLERLSESVDQDGNRLDIVMIPMPEKIEFGGAPLPASYANFYIGNRSVLVPVYHQKSDAAALEIFKGLFPNRKVVGIPSIPLIYGLGAIHCITQQQPATVDEAEETNHSHD